MCCINLWKDFGGLLSLNGNTLNLYSPSGVAKAVFSFDSSAFSVCQYPFIRSKVQNHFAPYNESKTSSIFAKGNEPFIVLAFNFLKSIHKRFFPSLFGNIIMGEGHGLTLTLIMPPSLPPKHVNKLLILIWLLMYSFSIPHINIMLH